MITYQGEEVWPDGKGAPTLYTIGVALGRIPRFCGHTQFWYPVLGHVLTVAAMLPDKYALFGLLHDAQESCMGDVPTPWKTEAARRRERVLLRRIYQANELEWPISEEAQEAVDWADKEALAAEAHVLGHPRAKEYWPNFDSEVASLVDWHLRRCTSYLVAGVAGPAYEEAFLHYRNLMAVDNVVELKAA